MINFTPKRLPREETWGSKLRQARLAKSLRIEDLARSLGIRREYLEALEEENYDRLPSGLYGKSFLKKYALRLGFRAKDIAAYLENIETGSPDDPFSQKIVKKNKFIIFPRLIRNFIFGAAVIACLLYLSVYARRVVMPPELLIIAPADNLLIQESAYTVIGQTEPEAEVQINEAIVLSNDRGRFSQAVNLKKGINTLTISAKKKYSRPRIEVKQILVE